MTKSNASIRVRYSAGFIETDTIDEFEEVMKGNAPNSFFQNLYSRYDEIASTPIQDLAPIILWGAP